MHGYQLANPGNDFLIVLMPIGGDLNKISKVILLPSQEKSLFFVDFFAVYLGLHEASYDTIVFNIFSIQNFEYYIYYWKRIIEINNVQVLPMQTFIFGEKRSQQKKTLFKGCVLTIRMETKFESLSG